jgi:SAM-dependent methyltransferase
VHNDHLVRQSREVAAYYDDLYASRTDVWRDQGHTDAFTRYVAGLVEAGGPGRYLDVGCGEGIFLEAAARMEGYGLDISREALRHAGDRTSASLIQGVAERLPFASGMFDAVTSIGAMEHFLDDVAATLEIRRVLRRSGRYVLALLVEITGADRLRIKARRLLSGPNAAPAPPGPPPDVRALPQQPVQNRYRPRRARALFERCGFRVAREITLDNTPDAPLPGHYMRFYCLEAV